MPWIDKESLRKISATQERYRDVLARQQAAIRLDELEQYLQSERERRGLKPVVTDTGVTIAWVRTTPQVPGGR